MPLDTSVAAGGEVRRPELNVIDARIRLADAQEASADAVRLPKLALFAQGFLGYPGLNMFEDMMERNTSLNGIVGLSLTWDVGSLYSRRNDKERAVLRRSMAEVGRATFLFDNGMEEARHRQTIGRYRELMSADREIIALRRAVRMASETKMAHGTIDVSDLVYDLKYSLNK